MKLQVLVANEEALKLLIIAPFENAQIAWDMADSVEIVEKAMTKFHEKRSEYIKRNGTPQEDQPDQFTMPDSEGFQKEVEKLLDVDIKVTFPVITIDDLNGMKVTAGNILSWKALGILIKKS